MRLLVTRPREEGERTASSLLDLGHEAVLAPVMQVLPVDGAAIPADCDATAITSANALKALSGLPGFDRLKSLPLMAVGDQTAAFARELGFRQVSSATGTAADLADLVLRHGLPKTAHLFHPVGHDRFHRLEDFLDGSGVAVTVVTVYRAEAVLHLPADIVELLRAGLIDGVLHYSRRSAMLLAERGQQAGFFKELLALRHYCLSPAIAEIWLEHRACHVFTAETPDENALLHCVMSCPGAI